MIVETNKDGIRVELRGSEQLWALRANIKIPTETITDVRYEPKFNDWRKWQVRMPGTHAPRLLLAGSYWTELGWDFLYIKRPARFLRPVVFGVLVVETDQNRYSRVILSSNKKEAKRVLAWWKKHSK